MIRTFLRRLFCRHRIVTFAGNIYGDPILWFNRRSDWECDRCGMLLAGKNLYGGQVPMKITRGTLRLLNRNGWTFHTTRTTLPPCPLTPTAP